MSGPCWYYRGGSCPTHGDQGWWKTREELCLPSSRLLVQEYTISGKAKYKEVTAVTTLPAKAGSFWLVPEAPVSAGASRATLTATRYVSARRLDPSPLSRTVYRDRCSPDMSGGVNATLTGERLTEPKLPGTRDMSCPRACPVEPPKHIVRGKVPSRRCHKEERLSSDGLVAQPVACGDPHSPPG